MTDVTTPTVEHAHGRAATVDWTGRSRNANILSWERGRLRRTLPLVVSRCMAFSAMTRFDDDLVAAVREFYGLELDVATAEAEILEDEEERIRFFPWFLWDWRVDPGLPTIAERFVNEADHDRYEARLLESLANSFVGFYEALADADTAGVALRCLVTGQELFVADEGLQGDLFARNILQARLVRIPSEGGGEIILVDAVYAVLPPEARPTVEVELSAISGHGEHTKSPEDRSSLTDRKSLQDRIKGYTPELLHFGDQLMETLAKPPQALNTDGAPLVLCTTTLPLASFGSGISRHTLSRCEALVRLHAESRQLYVFCPRESARGWVEVKNNTLVVGANSPDRLGALLEALEAELEVVLPATMTVMQDFDGAVQRWAEQGGGSRWLRADPEVREATVQWLHAWARHWLDMPSAALGDRTPREAVRDATGRKRVETMLKRFEALSQGHLSPGLMDQDSQLSSLRSRLGLPSS